MAAEIHAADPRQPLAVAILAETELDDGHPDKAETLLRPVFAADDQHPAILERLAKVHAANEDWSAARDLWEQGATRWPREPTFLRGLAATLLRLEDDERLREVLTKIADRDADDGLARKKLANMAFTAEDWPAAIRWGEEALHCDVRDSSVHRLLADAYARTGDERSASRHAKLEKRVANSE